MDHCVEGLCSNDSRVGEQSDKGCREGFKLLVPNLPITKKNWNALEPRLMEMYGVIEAIKGLGTGCADG